MPRLDPMYPPLWRDAETLQLGVAAVVDIHKPTLWQLRVLDYLSEGIDAHTEAHLAALVGARTSDVRAFLQLLAPAFAPETDRPIVALEAAPTPDADALAAALADAGMGVVRMPWHNTSAIALNAQAPVIVLAHHLVDPRRIARLMREDTIHLPVIFQHGGASIGPLVVPGHTACLACVGAYQTDAQEGWPMLASQLLFADPPALSPALVVNAAALAVEILRGGADNFSAARSVSVSAADGSRTWHAHRPHPECLCQSLTESATDAARGVPHLAPTSARVFARPA